MSAVVSWNWNLWSSCTFIYQRWENRMGNQEWTIQRPLQHE